MPGSPFDSGDAGQWMHELAQRLWPLHRSLTGDGVRQTLAVLKKELPDLVIHEVPSGTHAFDWEVPHEWNIRSARLTDPAGQIVVDLEDSNLHVVGYSQPVDQQLELADLQDHLHSDVELPDAIPYVTSYYHPTWGFCLPHSQREQLVDGVYHARIESELKDGSLTYGELFIPGRTDSEVFISTYICHPSMANNELSGPVVATALAKWLTEVDDRQFSYRFVFVPETIGALVYSSRKLEHLQGHVVAGLNLTCIGDDGDYSYLASRLANTPIDRIARRVVKTFPRPVEYSFVDRGSDERQYCAPGIDLPLISLMRTRYGTYREYHTSLDDLESVVTPSGLAGGFTLAQQCLKELENSLYFTTPISGEPQLGRRGLYHTMHARTVENQVLMRTHVLAYADGQHSLQDIAEVVGVSVADVKVIADELISHGLLEQTVLRVQV